MSEVDMDDIDYTDINGVEASCRVVPIEQFAATECVECYDLGDKHFEIWRKASTYYLMLFSFGLPFEHKYTSVASARRAMYKMAWDFSDKRVSLPRLDHAVL